MVHKSINNKAYNYANDTNISTAEELSLKNQENLNADIETLERWLDAFSCLQILSKQNTWLLILLLNWNISILVPSSNLLASQLNVF